MTKGRTEYLCYVPGGRTEWLTPRKMWGMTKNGNRPEEVSPQPASREEWEKQQAKLAEMLASGSRGRGAKD